jgi:peptidyl-prolyl cis-trans isomerase B (cyclophilin B)
MTQSKVKMTTNKGDIIIELDSEKAPITVANFLRYSDSGFYDNTIFHRVIDGFMIQGGGFESGMVEKETEAPIKNEAHNGLSNARGSIAMARTSDVNSATAQFFINIADNAPLDYRGDNPQEYGYAVFGKVIEGLDVVDDIKSVKTDQNGHHGDVPVEEIVIESVTTLESDR